MGTAPDDTLEALRGAVTAIASERSLDDVLRLLTETARDLVGARYAALGIPNAEGTGFARFLTVGMSDDQITAIGPLPRTHGLLGATLAETEPFRSDDIAADPRAWGWPLAHPDMRSFLGVPIVSRGRVLAAFYLTEKRDAVRFDAADERLIVLLAAHAAIAISNARMFARSRELTVIEERNRLARELHDSMTQTLFSLTLTAETAASLMRDDPERAATELRRVLTLARTTQSELRTLIDQLRPPDLERHGIVATLRSHVQVLSRAHGIPISLRIDGEEISPDAATELAVFRIIGEALHNALRHAGATRLDVAMAHADGSLVATVDDDGVGFDPASPALRSRHLGLTSMRERAREAGGRLRIDSAAGRGTTVEVTVPLVDVTRPQGDAP